MAEDLDTLKRIRDEARQVLDAAKAKAGDLLTLERAANAVYRAESVAVAERIVSRLMGQTIVRVEPTYEKCWEFSRNGKNTLEARIILSNGVEITATGDDSGVELEVTDPK